jgi:YebC/PmpR family DNA-binding regulatory protein
MSGHSKWHNIRVRKTAADAKRNKVYTRHAKLIEMAARSGGNPDMNPGLRTAIDNAKAENVPNANIDRAIQKGTGELKGAAAIEEVTYAAYGPGNVACLIECLTDNRNRTVAQVKLAISKAGGHWAESSSVMWMFHRKGVVVGERAGLSSEALETIELALIDAGAEDVEADGDILRVVCDMGQWTTMREAVRAQGFSIISAGLCYVPTQHQAIDEPTRQKLDHFIEALEEDDDVTEIFTNAS